MGFAKSGVVVFAIACILARFSGDAMAEDAAAPKSAVAKWYAEDKTRFPKCKVAPEIEKVYPDIHATLAALKYALVHDEGWENASWKHPVKISEVRRGEVEALDDANMMIGWKADQMPMKQIKKGAKFNDGVTDSATLVKFHQHAFNFGNDVDDVAPRPPAEVMRTIAHELAHVWDHRVHTITLHSVDLTGGLTYQFQEFVPDEAFKPESILEIRRLQGSAPKETPKLAKEEPADDPNRPENPTKIYIYAVNTSGLSLWLGTPVEAKALISSRNLKDSGTSGAKVEAKKLRNEPFDSRNDAVVHLKQYTTEGPRRPFTGKFFVYHEVEYRIVHVPEILGADAKEEP